MHDSGTHRSARWSAVALAGLVAALMLSSSLASVASTAGRTTSTRPLPSALGAPIDERAPLTAPVVAGPHPGALDVYEVAPGGGHTEDPAVAYDTVSSEPILNVYQTLVAYNGSSTSGFVPELATCVPGTSQCVGLYGMSLIDNNATTGSPQFFTFVIDSGAHFYDPATEASWGVYPSDVMFSLSRTMSFANLPGVGVTNGWIQTQALLPYGDSSYDNRVHSPWNNTPGNVLSSMLVNDSAYCPSAAMTQDHGCITFNADGSGSGWPFFLQLVADPLGAGIVPCGWFSYVGAGVPGFEGTTAANGDGSCLLPGGATSTTQLAFQSYVATVDPTSWDALQMLEASNPGNPQPAVTERMVGSGPYFTESIDHSIGYVLQANPAYQAPSGCAGQPGCQPLPGAYQATVNVFWEETDVQGIANYQAGQADLAGIQLPAHASTLNALLSAGRIDLMYVPTLSIFFMPYNLNFSVTGVNSIAGNPNATNVPGDFLSQIGVRQFITNAYPYATISTTLLQLDNISTGFGYGGAIPKYLGNYYSDNITWPESDPIADPNVTGSAAWWWAQANNASSLYYDSELSACTTIDPCTFPIIDETGETFYGSVGRLLVNEITSLSGGRLAPYSFTTVFGNCDFFGCPTPPMWNGGWAPDYPDPTDYVTPMYLPDTTYTFGDSVSEELGLPEFNSPSCPFAANYSDPSSAWAALVYYHGLQELPNACQGIAYGISTYWYEEAAPLPIGAQRTLDYQLANQLDYLLSLYIWNFQSEIPESYAPWINAATLNTNPMIGGGGVNSWFTVQYASALATASVTASGLPSGTSWTATVGYETETGTGSALSFRLAPGTYNYYIWPADGYGVGTANGSVRVTAGTATSVAAVFTSYGTTPLVGVTFSQSGIISGSASWTAIVPGVGAWYTTSTSMTVRVPAGTYAFTVNPVAGYTLANSTGTVTAAAGASVTIAFVSIFPTKSYAIVLTESGLSPGVSWTATLNGFAQMSTEPSITFYQANGTYAYSVGPIPGYTANPSSGLVMTTASPVVVTIDYAPIPTTGTLTLSLNANGPLTAALYINGISHGPISAGQPTSYQLSAGTYALQVIASGYYNYYNNATVTGGTTTSVNVTMDSNSPSSSTNAISSTAWALIGLFAALTAILLATTAYFVRRARPPIPPPQSGSSGSAPEPGGPMPPPSN